MKKKQGFAITPYKGPDHWKWRNGHSRCNGYEMIKRPNHPYANKRGYVLEHRLVVEDHIRRYLPPDVRVHHINGNRLDNRIENLVMMNHRSHIRKHKGTPGAKWHLLEDLLWLKHQISLSKSLNQIAKIVGCAAKTVFDALERHGIKQNFPGQFPASFEKLRDKAWLAEKTKTMSQREIAELLGCNNRLVWLWRKRHQIKSLHKPGPKVKS